MKTQSARATGQMAGHTLGRLLMAVVLTITASLPAGAATPAPGSSTMPTAAERIRSVVDYQNQFTNLDELIGELNLTGTISDEEKNGIENFLDTQKVDRKAPLRPTQAQGAMMRAGHVSLTLNENGSFKTQSGRVLRSVEGQAKDQMFIETFNALREKSVGAKWDLLVPRARAADDVGEFIEEALVGLGRVIASGIALIAIPVCGIPAMAVDYVLSHVREWIWKGSVECRHGRFVSVGFESFGGQVEKDYRVVEKVTPRVTLSKELDAAAFAVCGAPIGRLIPGNPMSRARYRQVDSGVIAQAFHGHVPRCTDRTAAHLTDQLRSHGKAIENAIVHQANRAHTAVRSITQPPPEDRTARSSQ